MPIAAERNSTTAEVYRPSWPRTGGTSPTRLRSARYGTGKRWHARWRDADRKQTSRTFDRKLDAENFLADLHANLVRGSYIDPRGQGHAQVIRRAAVAALPGPPAPEQRQPVRLARGEPIVPLLGDRPLGALRPDCGAS